MTDQQNQREKFERAARDLECDEDEAHWDETLKRVTQHQPAPQVSPEKPK